MPTIKDQLLLHEGLKLYPYLDTVGTWTIGVGRNLSDKGITLQTAFQMLDEDISECILDLETFPFWSGLDPIRQKVMIDMRFNLGPKGFRGFTNTLKSVAAGNYVDASKRMLQSKWAKQVKGRAIRLSNMMRTGEDFEL